MAVTETETVRALLDWGYPPGAVRFVDRPLIFVGYGETSDCQAVVQRASAESGAVSIEIGLEQKGSCTTDSRPRSFVLDVGTTVVDSVDVNGERVQIAGT